MLKKFLLSLIILASFSSCGTYREMYRCPYKLYIPDNEYAAEKIEALRCQDIETCGKVFRVSGVEKSVVVDGMIVLYLEEKE
jgi:hypothetical protein